MVSIGEAELLLAYEMVLVGLPRREEWSGTVSLRADGSSADGIFSVLEAFRAELYSRIGGKSVRASGHASALGGGGASCTDVVSAYELAAASIPGRDKWYDVVAARPDAVSAEGVFHVIALLRAELHEAIGDCVAGSIRSGLAGAS